MKKITIVAAALVLVGSLTAQNTYRFTVKDSATGEALTGVTVAILNTTLGAVTDANGLGEIANVPNGNQSFTFSYLGYKKQTFTKTFPVSNDTGIAVIRLAPENAELEEVIISSTRTNSRIEDLPQKIEVLGEADLLEESTLKPGNISSMLGDISVIHIQQTSQTNGNVAVRMQGLDGRYTQILRDGLPAFGGFAGSFDVMSIPPLDLKQIEVIKGAASTLYGAGAISGLINMLSKTPTDSNRYSFTANYSTLREANLNGFFSGRKGRFGFTMFAGTTQQMASDMNKDGFSDVPKLSSYIVHPRLFIDVAKMVKINIGYTGTYENRAGGDMYALKFKPDSVHAYYESNKVQRHTADLQLSAAIKNGHDLLFKAATNIFDRNVDNSGTVFHGEQITTYSEASYRWQTPKNTLITGFNLLNDNFRLRTSDSANAGNYNYFTYGLFAQTDWQINEKLLVEPGMRIDYHSRYKWFFLPHLAFLIKPIASVSVRLSGGTGYNAPNLFADKEYTGKLNWILPLSADLKPERSVGANADVNYHAVFFNALALELNQAFYYTWLPKPLNLAAQATNMYAWYNSSYNIHSVGTDTYIRLGYKSVEFYIGYNHTTSLQIDGAGKQPVLFAPQDKLSNTIVYEIEAKWRFGIEGSLVANQYIEGNRKARNYYLLAAMVERKFGRRWSIILNGENLLNVKQGNYQMLYTGTMQAPLFNQLYAPIDGWVLNLCLQVQL